MLTTFLSTPPRRKLVALAKGYDARTFARLAGFSDWYKCKLFTLEIPLHKQIYELHALDKDASGPVLIVPPKLVTPSCACATSGCASIGTRQKASIM